MAKILPFACLLSDKKTFCFMLPDSLNIDLDVFFCLIGFKNLRSRMGFIIVSFSWNFGEFEEVSLR